MPKQQPQPSSWPGIIGIGLILGFIYFASTAKDEPSPPSPRTDTTVVATKAGNDYSYNLAQNFRSAYSKCQSGEIKDEAELHKFLSETNKQIRSSSFIPVDQILNSKAGDFQGLISLLIPIAEGLEKASK